MARDTAAASFAARTPIAQMDRPSVERELRHVHNDTSHYPTAHAARDALATARDRADARPGAPNDRPTTRPAAAVTGPDSSDSSHHVQATYGGQRVYVTFSVGLDLKMHIELQHEPTNLNARNLERLLRRIDQDPSLTDITVDGRPHSTTSAATATTANRPERDVAAQRTPPGGWTEADRVPPAQPADTSAYPSAQRFPLGTELTVHAIGDDGPGRRLGHGVVVGYPGPGHVTVESPYGTRRHAPISHVSTDEHPAADVNPRSAPTTGITTPRPDNPADRWRDIAAALDPRVIQDPHWPALARVLDRIAADGLDVPALLEQVTAERALPDDHPARSLDYRLATVAPDPTAVDRVRIDADQRTHGLTPPPPAPPTDPGYRPGPRR